MPKSAVWEGWRRLARWLWPERLSGRLATELVGRDAELRHLHTGLLAARVRVEQLRDAVRRNERRMTLLTAQVGLRVGRTDYPAAYDGALALETTRQTLEELRDHLAQAERAYERRRSRFARLKGERDTLASYRQGIA